MALLASVLAAVAVLVVFVAAWRLAPRHALVDERLAAYGSPTLAPEKPAAQRGEGRLARRLGRSRTGERVATLLSQADMPLTAGEYMLLSLAIGAVGYVLGAWRIHPLVGLVLGVLGAAGPLFWARMARSRRRRAIGNQLPDVLTLITGALRAGYGLAQAIDVVAREGPQPSAKEYARVLRATELGVSLPRALDDMAKRVDVDDVNLLVTAINVQHEVGGNLSAVLDSIAGTIRERVRILREIRTLTAQQRMTGYILAAMPIGLAAVFAFIQPGYFNPFFEPGWVRMMPIAALGMMGIAFFLIQRILDIKV
jgi:tight adherence protein B